MSDKIIEFTDEDLNWNLLCTSCRQKYREAIELLKQIKECNLNLNKIPLTEEEEKQMREVATHPLYPEGDWEDV